MTRIFTDVPIRVNPRHPRNPCSNSASLHTKTPEIRDAMHLQFARTTNLRSSAFICGSFFAEARDSRDADSINRMDRISAFTADLSNKTAIQEYYRHEFQNLIEVLVKNRKKLKAGYDPKSPANYKHLLEWYKTSVDRLAPLMGRIEATDRLIDQIVYRLYGLTEDEIKIVEGSIPGEKDEKENNG